MILDVPDGSVDRLPDDLQVGFPSMVRGARYAGAWANANGAPAPSHVEAVTSSDAMQPPARITGPRR
jgi:hypothetical protein